MWEGRNNMVSSQASGERHGTILFPLCRAVWWSSTISETSEGIVLQSKEGLLSPPWEEGEGGECLWEVGSASEQPQHSWRWEQHKTLVTARKQTESVRNSPGEGLRDCNFHMHAENSSRGAWGLREVLCREVEKQEKYSQVSWSSAWLRRKQLRGRLCWSSKNHHVLCWEW